VADAVRTARLVEHLQDPAEFDRPHRVPTLSADSPGYVPEGGYWHGAVWAPTNYMILRGLAGSGHGDLARTIAENHLDHVAKVFAAPPEGQPNTIWECYAPELARPASTDPDRPETLSRQDFVGWSGLGPIAMLIENVLGFTVDGADGRVTWDLTRTDRHGIERLPVGGLNLVGLVAAPRAAADGPVEIAATARRSYVLEVRRPGRPAAEVTVPAGTHTLKVP